MREEISGKNKIKYKRIHFRKRLSNDDYFLPLSSIFFEYDMKCSAALKWRDVYWNLTKKSRMLLPGPENTWIQLITGLNVMVSLRTLMREATALRYGGGDDARESAKIYEVHKNTGFPPKGAFIFYSCSGKVEGELKIRDT